MTRNRLILSLGVLLFVAGGLWLACSETGVTPPAAPAGTPDKGWTATGADTSATEATLDPALVASQRPSRATGYAAVLTQLRLEDKYGQRWDEVASLISAIAVLKGADKRVGVFNEMLDPVKLTHWKSIFPVRSVARSDSPFGNEAQSWEALRRKIRTQGGVPVPESFAEMQARHARMTDTERVSYAVELLTEYVEYLKSAPLAEQGVTGRGGAMLSVTPFGILSASTVATQRRSRTACVADCQRRATDLINILYGICADEFLACCRDEGGCRNPPNTNDAYDYCEVDYYDCTDDAAVVYREWFSRCTRACR